MENNCRAHKYNNDINTAALDFCQEPHNFLCFVEKKLRNNLLFRGKVVPLHPLSPKKEASADTRRSSLIDLHKQTSSTRSEMATSPLSQGVGGLNRSPVVILGN